MSYLQVPVLGFFIYDCKRVVQNIKPYGMGMFCGDLLESANAVIKEMHNNYSNRAGGRGAKIDLPEASLRVVQQCQNRIFLRTELPRWLGKTKAQEVHVAQVVNADGDTKVEVIYIKVAYTCPKVEAQCCQ